MLLSGRVLSFPAGCGAEIKGIKAGIHCFLQERAAGKQGMSCFRASLTSPCPWGRSSLGEELNWEMLGMQHSHSKDAIPSTSRGEVNSGGFGETNPEIHFNSRTMAWSWLA